MRKLLNILLITVCLLACTLVMTSCFNCNHTDIDANGSCDVCGTAFTCPGHSDVNADGMCDTCLTTFVCTVHYDQDANLKCDVCGMTYICTHSDKNADSVCDTCRAPFACPGHCDVNKDGLCDVCSIDYVCPGHEDADVDFRCDICKTQWACTAHKDSDGNDQCDYCKADFMCEGHIDAGSDGRCDRCDVEYNCPGHTDRNGDTVCDICLGYYKVPEDLRSEFTKAADNTKPSVLEITAITEVIGKGTVTTKYTVTYAADGSFVISGQKQKFNESLEGEFILTDSINITCDASGNYSDGGEFAGSNPAVKGLSVDFTKLLDNSYETPNSTILKATVLKANTEAVFGVAYDNDVNLVVNKGADSITNVTVSYTVVNGTAPYANVTIICNYK